MRFQADVPQHILNDCILKNHIKSFQEFTSNPHPNCKLIPFLFPSSDSEPPLPIPLPNILPMQRSNKPIAISKLYAYQKECVDWMIFKETNDIPVHPFCSIINSTHVNRATGVVGTCHGHILSRGGLLCDVMGLGKSIQILSLILSNKPANGWRPYTDLIISNATLIIAPDSIISQWISEIKTHTQLKCLYFTKDKLDKGKSRLDPKKLHLSVNSFDIVLVSFRTIANEIHRARPDNQRSRRQVRAYERPTSFFTSIYFYRLVVDEAQMASPTSNPGEICRMISSYMRWAVSGTPGDLKHLIEIVGPEVLGPFAQMRPRLRDLPHIVWRNTLKSVQGQIALPPIHALHYSIPFSKIEQTKFGLAHNPSYDELLSETMAGVIKEISESGFSEAEARRNFGARLSHQVLLLRQAWQVCINPVSTRNSPSLTRKCSNQ